MRAKLPSLTGFPAKNGFSGGLYRSVGFGAGLARYLRFPLSRPLRWHANTGNREHNMSHPVDTHVGQRVRQRRWMIGMTQQQLAEKVGIKFQQIQKYETGANRVSASRLWDISEALDVPVAFFFEGLTGAAQAPGERGNMLTDREALDLVRAYYAIPPAQRRSLFDLAQVLGADAAA
jgi:transcriptional regulator with XRE-family HTH domain